VLGKQLSLLSDLLDEYPLILDCVESDFRVADTAATGANGLSVESVFRSLLLKQILKVSYEKLSFHNFPVVPVFNPLFAISARRRLNK